MQGPFRGSPITRATEGYHRRAFSVGEVLRMPDIGIFHPDEKFELIEGDIVPRWPKHSAHERIKTHLGMALIRACPGELMCGIGTSLFLSKRTFVQPDICLYSKDIRSDKVKGPDIVLAIDVAEETLDYDRTLKTRIFQCYGTKELWVIDATRRRTFIHRRPLAEGWESITEHGPDFGLTIDAVPGFSQRLDQI